MKYRTTTILARTDLGAAGTKSIDINIKDVISRIEITFEGYVDGAQATQWAGNLPKIELIDGSEVIFSLTGFEAQALGIYSRKCPTLQGPFSCAGNYWLGTFPIDFGRYLWDPVLAFDPTRYINPQLRITYDEDVAMAATTTSYMEVIAYCFDEFVPSPIGFLMAKEHHSYTPAAENAYEYIDLPTDYPIRQLLVRAFLTQKCPNTVVDELRITEENDKRVVCDLELNRYVKQMMGVWPSIHELWEEYATIVTTTTYYRYFTPTSEFSSAIASPRTGFKVFANEDSMRGGYLQWHGEDGIMYCGHVHGWLPLHCIQFPFGVQNEIDSWYDVQNKGSVRMRLLSAGDYSGSVVSTVLEQLRRY